MARKLKHLAPIHPGEILAEHFMKDYGITAYRVATDMGLRPPGIYELIHGRRPITAPIALRLGRYFGNSAQFWINLQSHYDLERAALEIGEQVEQEVTPLVSQLKTAA